jgi:hypothetical protein
MSFYVKAIVNVFAVFVVLAVIEIIVLHLFGGMSYPVGAYNYSIENMAANPAPLFP